MTDFSQKILTWYSLNKRDLPWRNISDPYKIWVSEIILQQTRIVQGYDYYLRFISAFPDVKALAEADEDAVLRMWQGLGYYSRARNIHAAAKQVMELWQGEFPTTYEGIRSLKGIGDYTAAAISSFAFHQPYAVVDGNVYRVLSRYFGIDIPIDTTQGKKYFAALAQQLLPIQQNADYNQGLMDFGATQCLPTSPNCEMCVLNGACVAYNAHRVGDFPIKSRKLKTKERFFVYIKVVTPQGVWLTRRGGNDIWQGLYEYPLIEFDHTPTMADLLQTDFVKQLPQGGRWKTVKERYRHVLTHQVIWADLYTLTFDSALPAPAQYIVVANDTCSQYAMPQLIHKLEHN